VRIPEERDLEPVVLTVGELFPLHGAILFAPRNGRPTGT
jgi:hypothetical protein